MKNVKVFFEPDNIEVEVPQGSKISTALQKAGIHFDLPCGGKGICGKCRVKVLSGVVTVNDTEKKHLGDKADQGWRLACQARINQSSRISVEKEVYSYHKILSANRACGVEERNSNPNITKKLFFFPEITLQNPISLQENIGNSVGLFPCEISFEVVKSMATEKTGEFTGVFYDKTLLGIEKGNTTKTSYGIGFDLGTTTMVLTLYDMPNCKEVVSVVKPNPQIQFGDDIISRVGFSMEKDGLIKLQQIIISEINKMIDESVKITGISRNNIYQFNLSGNTVMEQIFLKVQLNSLSTIPFNPVIKGPIIIKAKEVNLNINPEGQIFIFPVLGGFVGGDAVALVLATGIHRSEQICIGIDIGTNGEIVIGNKNGMISASTAAGPAFEGGRITYGMRAQTGALEKYKFNEEKMDFQYTIIGGNSLKGICGSGLVDVISSLKKAGLLESSGRFVPLSSNDLSKKYIRMINEHPVFVFEPEKQDSIHLTQKDVREFQSAKGAIRTGVEILMSIYGTTIDKIDKIYLAGALGNFASIDNLKEIGMLPEIDAGKIVSCGNTSLGATIMYLCNKDLTYDINQIISKTKVIELSLYPKFQDVFTDSLFL
jgi:uncharacterized 2Fe-2S/4Fe-4S cluster protein (DUF4445 family)